MSKQHSTPPALSANHRRILEHGSGIDHGVVRERGYYTARRRSEVPEAFADYQRRLGLVVPMYSPDGTRGSHQLRPDKPRRNGPKYETPAGSEVLVDVHPRMLDEVRHGDGDLWITEGVKKGDALTSHGLPTISLAGVWMWCVPKVKPYRLKSCFDHVRLDGRRVYVVFDSDVLVKPEVQQALQALVEALEDRGADVRVVYLPQGEAGSAGYGKTGVDDYLVAGGTVAELKMLARKFEPSDIGKMRLSKDARLRAGIADLENRFWSEEWRGMGGHSDRDVALKLIEAATRHGKLVADGIRVVKAQGPLALEAKVNSRTLWKALNRLEERGFLYRDNEGRKHDKAGAFVLRASVSQVVVTAGPEGNVTQGLQACDRGDLHLRAPRLMWSRPKYTPKRGTTSGTRKVRQGPKPEARDGITRLGKIRGAIIDALDGEGPMDINELAAKLHRKRARDLRRRNLPMLEETGIITVEDGRVSLTDNWLDAVEDQRRLGGEIDSESVDGRVEEGAETIARRRYENKRRAFHNRGQDQPTPHWTNAAGADGALEDLQSVREPEPEKREAERDPESTADVAAVLGYVQKLGRIRLGLLEEVWLERHGGDLARLRRAIDAAGVQRERLREFGNREFLFPPAERVAS